MQGSLWHWILAALLLFWSVGLYRRLLGMRLAAQLALDALEPPLALYSSLLAAYTQDASGRPQAPAWVQLTGAVAALPARSQAARNAPFVPAPLQALAAQMDGVASAWEQLQQQPADLAGSPLPQELVRSWQEAEFGVRAARTQFNQQVQAYNAALRQFPASLVVWLMGFRPAVTL